MLQVILQTQEFREFAGEAGELQLQEMCNVCGQSINEELRGARGGARVGGTRAASCQV
jgi:hypothetical protein